MSVDMHWALARKNYHEIMLERFVLFRLVSHVSTSPRSTVYQSKFNELLSQYDVYTRIFADGSKSGEAVESAAIVASRVCKKRLPNNSSIFSAEARGILLALDMILRSTDSQLLFLSDSYVPAKSSKSRPLTPYYCRDFVSRAWSNIKWFQSCLYVGLAGNLAVDSAAKDALLPPVSNVTVPHSDYKSLIRLQVLRWNCETENKLQSIEPKINVINMFRLPRQDEDLTVEHVLLHGVSFTNARDNSFCATLIFMSELFLKVASRSIIDFIKETGFYHKI